MNHIDYAIARIRAYIENGGMAKSRLATLAGIPESSLRKYSSQDWNPTSETVRKIESVIPIDFVEPVNCKSQRKKNT